MNQIGQGGQSVIATKQFQLKLFHGSQHNGVWDALLLGIV